MEVRRVFQTIQVRRYTANEWIASNRILLSGEFGYETDTGKVKIGDGVTSWNSLAYLQGSGGGGADGLSAYEIAVQNGFEGTEAEWLESLSPVRYMDGDIFEGDGETPETKTTIKDGSLGEGKLSEAVRDKLGNEAVEIESNTVLFDQDYIIGNAGARTGNVLFDFTGAVLGSCTVMVHEDANPFTLPDESVVIGGEVKDSVTNYIYFLLVNKTSGLEKVHVTISQEVI